MNKITLEIITKIISLQNKQIKGLRKEINTLREEIKSKENLNENKENATCNNTNDKSECKTPNIPPEGIEWARRIEKEGRGRVVSVTGGSQV